MVKKSLETISSGNYDSRRSEDDKETPEKNQGSAKKTGSDTPAFGSKAKGFFSKDLEYNNKL